MDEQFDVNAPLPLSADDRVAAEIGKLVAGHGMSVVLRALAREAVSFCDSPQNVRRHFGDSNVRLAWEHIREALVVAAAVARVHLRD